MMETVAGTVYRVFLSCFTCGILGAVGAAALFGWLDAMAGGSDGEVRTTVMIFAVAGGLFSAVFLGPVVFAWRYWRRSRKDRREAEHFMQLVIAEGSAFEPASPSEHQDKHAETRGDVF